MYGLYRSITYILSPLMPYWLERRKQRGKEDAERLPERFGHASLRRPVGKLVWVHAASVGESNSALPLIKTMLEANPALHVLLTTGTVTSAGLMAKRLPPRALHQFAPIDTPQAVGSFIEHWHPQLALFVDSELWPNLIMAAHKRGAVLAMVNARMSEKSIRKWKLAMPLLRQLLGQFAFCFAQSNNAADRLLKLGVDKIHHVGNLKYDVPPLAYNEAELERLKQQIGDRVVWVAASTHHGEDEQIAEVHVELQQKYPDVLTIIVPRHPARSDEIVDQLEGLSIARRSRNDPIFPETDIYLADTLGELGLFYRLAKVAFIGGSLVPHGGQNPIEALQLGCAVVLGPDMDNFRTVAHLIERADACIRVHDNHMLAGAVSKLLSDEIKRKEMTEAGYVHIQSSNGAVAAVAAKLQPSIIV